MIFIFGAQPKQLEHKTGEFDCPICQTRTQYSWRTQRTYASVFFLPLFPIGKPHSSLTCQQCHTVLPEKFLP